VCKGDPVILICPVAPITPSQAEIDRAVEHTPGYVLIDVVDGAPTWVCALAYRGEVAVLERRLRRS
jgi:hypothetical protein